MAGKTGIKKKEGENLSDANIDKVIALLRQENPIKKKEACELLNIAYNTTRLAKIIEQHEEQKAEEKRRRDANRGKPVAEHEKSLIISWALAGESVSEIAKQLYRSIASVKQTIAEIGIPEKGESYWRPALIPEQCLAEEFKTGQLVWLAQMNQIGVITEKPPSIGSKTGQLFYQVYAFYRLEEDSPFFRNCRAGDWAGTYGHYAVSEIGSLEHLKKYGVDLYREYQDHFPLAVRKAIGMEK